MFTDKASCFPSLMVGDMCGGKNIDLKTVAPRNVIGCVVRHQGGVSYDGSTDLYAILKVDLTEFHYRDEINKAFVILMLVLWNWTLCLWTETPFRAGLVFRDHGVYMYVVHN